MFDNIFMFSHISACSRRQDLDSLVFWKPEVFFFFTNCMRMYVFVISILVFLFPNKCFYTCPLSSFLHAFFIRMRCYV